jgi:outer membrane protein insertion porin family
VRGLRALLSTLVLACAASAQEEPRPPLQREQKVVAVRFEGNRRYTDEFLKEHIATKEGETYDPGLLARDERLLREFFAAVLDIETNFVEGGVELVFHVLDRIVVGKVEFRGLKKVQEDDFEALLSTRSGRPLHDFGLKSDVDLIERMHREKGYHFVEVNHYRRRTTRPDVEDVVFQVIAGERVRVLEVVLEGAYSLERSKLLEYAKNSDRYRTKFLGLGKIFDPSYFDRAALEEDRAQMELYYRREGWLDARVVLVGVRFDDGQEYATIHFRIEEGPRYTVRGLTVEYVPGGEPEEADRDFLSPEALSALSAMPVGGAYRDEDFAVSVRRVQERLYSRYYSTAEIQDERTAYPSDHSVDLRLRIRAGPKVRLGRIRIYGNRFTRDNVIRREFREGALPGEYLDFEAVESARGRLMALQYFSFVRLGDGQGRGLVKSPNPDLPDEYDLEVEVEETDTREMQFGAGVSTDGGAFASFSVTWRNFDIRKPPDRFWGILDRDAFRGGGQRFTLSLAPGTTFSSFTIAYSDPAVRDSRWSLATSAARRLAFFDTYEQTTDALSVRVGRYIDLRRRWYVTAEWFLRQVLIDDPEPDAPVNALDVQGTSSEHGFGFTLRRARRREADPFLNGSVTTLSAEVMGGFLGADVDMWKLTLEHNMGWRILQKEDGGWHRLRADTGFFWATGFGDTDDVPIFERFFLGGRNLRGFEFREVGPKSNDSPTGGEFMATVQIQYTVPLTDQDAAGFGIDVHFFVDQGGLVEDLDLWTSEDWRVSAGFGFGISFGRGAQPPLQLDFAWPLRDQDADDTQVISISFERIF